MRGSFDAEAFHAALDSQRDQRGITWKQVADETGVNASTLARMPHGKCPDANGLAALLTWSGLQAEKFIKGGEAMCNEPDTLAQITAVLRADRSLSKQSAAAIEEILRAAYRRFRE